MIGWMTSLFSKKDKDMSCTFDEDAYRDQQLNKYLDEQEETEEDVEAYENAMADKADAERELKREDD